MWFSWLQAFRMYQKSHAGKDHGKPKPFKGKIAVLQPGSREEEETAFIFQSNGVKWKIWTKKLKCFEGGVGMIHKPKFCPRPSNRAIVLSLIIDAITKNLR